jgi:hypothetical protein
VSARDASPGADALAIPSLARGFAAKS